MKPIGIMKITLDQTEFNPNTDYIEKDDDGNIIGMYADYYSNNVTPMEEENIFVSNIRCRLSASSDTLKVGGSYKLITASFLDIEDVDISDKFILSKDNWKAYIDNEDITDSGLITWLEQTDNNKIRIKFKNDRSYLDKVITIKCTIDKIVGELKLNLSI